ncbi:hypothetical protein LIER_30476 [Lithospermum erythrorhizon]|uniref:Uncharacterized protein n=1 Tax=Lithospermum erythrorhizon TaxID=34254 RepID=A0AAV3RTL0_LITER
MLIAIPLNLGDNNDGVEVNENPNDKEDDVKNEGNDNDKEDDVENEEEDNDFEYSESEKSDSKDNGEDEDLNLEDVLYGKEHDGFDDGDLPGSQPSLSPIFLENIEEVFVVPEHNGHTEADVEVHSDDSDNVVEPTSGTEPNCKQRKGPQMSTCEKTIFDGRVSEGQTKVNKKKRYRGPYTRHGLQFKQRKLSDWVDSVESDSDSVLSDRHDMSDFDSDDSTSDSNGTIDFKEVMKWYSLIRRKDIWLTCNESHRLRARCKYLCDWQVWLSRDKKLNDIDLMIKTISRKHKNCLSTKKRRMVKSTWLAKVLQDWFRLLPDISISVLRLAVDTKYGLLITDNQARRVREKAIEGDYNDLVWDYIEELKRTHPGSTMFAEYDESDEDVHAGIFKRVYVCLRSLIDGFKSDLGIVDEEDYVIMSDRQKGLESALHELLPNVGHRNNVQHIYRNFKRHHSSQRLMLQGLESVLHEFLPNIGHRNNVQHIYRYFKRHHSSQVLRDKVWACARASTKARYHNAMLALKETDVAAHSWMKNNFGKPEHWCKEFFSLSVQSDMLYNNLSGSFSSFILSARDKPIITMLDRIRRLCMERIKDRKLEIGAKLAPLCPRINKIIQNVLNYADGLDYV